MVLNNEFPNIMKDYQTCLDLELVQKNHTQLVNATVTYKTPPNECALKIFVCKKEKNPTEINQMQ